MATLEELISLQHSTYKELKTCLESEKNARTVFEELEVQCAEHNGIIRNQENVTSRLKAAAKREYLKFQNQKNSVFKPVFRSHKLDEQREIYRKAFQAEQDAVIQLENMEAEEENLRKQTLAAKQEYQRYKYQHLQLDRFIANIFQEATNVENYPELTALTAKIEQENQAKSRCQPEHHQAERKRRDISSAIQSLEKASKALAFGIDAPTLLDTFSNRDDYRDSVKSAKRHVESAVHLLKTQGDPEADSLKVVLDSMMLRKDTFWDEQSERNQKRRAQLQLWEAQIRGTLKGLQINLLAPLTKKVNDLKRRIKNYDDILMALKDDILEKQQQILDDILSDIPVYQPAGGPPPYVPEPATSTA